MSVRHLAGISVIPSLLILSFAGVGCVAEEEVTADPYFLFGPEVKEVRVEVDYQAGAAPFVRGNRLMEQPWDFFRINAEALFARHPRDIHVPSGLEEMERIDDIAPKTKTFTTEAIMDIAALHRDAYSDGLLASYYVIFLDGHYADENGKRDDVLGVTVGSTGVVAMFKPVIRKVSGSRFAEQATLIHEFGHAIGLVNFGLPVVGDHHDEANGAHCNNEDCVMYYLNEGRKDLVEFIERFEATGDAVMFGPDCLRDAFAAGA